MLYPLKLQPIYKETIWGGSKLREKFNKDIPSDYTGESWEVACHKNGTSIISNGALKGKSLDNVIKLYGVLLLGSRVGVKGVEKFPLLVKILDASDKLSVQVHPDDGYAMKHEKGELGKTEMWYVIDAEPGAQLIYGVKQGTTQQKFKQSIIDGNLEEQLNHVDVEAGDVFHIPSKTLHAIGKGILIVEIQQNSDTTYRVYDWNRVGADGTSRKLHIKKALDVADLSEVTGKEKVEGQVINIGTTKRTHLVDCKYYTTEKIEVKCRSEEQLNGEKFDIIIVIDGEGKIEYNLGDVTFNDGDSFLIPACMGDYSIIGRCTILKTYAT